MEDLQGTFLKDYKLEELIGNGGFGAVYRATQTAIGREVAVKVILPNYANNPAFIRRFESEAYLIARLEHPHITPLHDFWRDPDGAYLVMRYLRGGSVQHSLREGSYELNAISLLLEQIASALDFAHRNDIIHRDIKPGNILLDEDGNAYLADFGIAKDLAGLAENETAADAVVGSLDYISPEQARSEAVTPRTDIYSLGVTLYEMITSEHPFKDASSIERLYKHINDPLPHITNFPENICDALNKIIQKATAKNPDHRYPDVLALSVAFREAIGQDANQHDLSIVEQLTMREQEILSLISAGKTNAEIAAELVVTMSTVKWHITQLYKKLGVRSRVQAIVRARELNLIVNGDTRDDWGGLTQTPTAISLPEPENPYKGLHAFQVTDAREFFGRDDLTNKLIERMRSNQPYHRFLAIVGPSGSGKSSLVKAGLIPALWRGAIPGSEKWFVVDMIPGAYPLDKLETALIRVAANHTTNLREQLQRDERGLLRVSDIILPGDDTELVIIVDQFEEVFTLVEDEEARQHFLDLLRIAVSDVRSRVRVVVTLRADYYDRPLHYPDFGDLVRSQMETVLPLSAKGLERAIRGPAERAGVTFEQGLVEQIVSTMNYQSGALPLLQYALTELFDRRDGRILTNQAYQEIGGAVGALANRADEVYLSLTDAGQALAHQVFMRLVTLGEGAEDTRRRVSHAELLSLTEDTDLMEEIIDQFAAYRLLSLDHDPETRQPTIEVAHEAILREWDRLRAWLNDSRDDIRQERAVSRAAEEWKNHHQETSYLLRGVRLEQAEKWQQSTKLIQTPLEQDFIYQSIQLRNEEQRAEQARKKREVALEKRSRNFLRTLVAVFGIAAVVSIGFGMFALQQQRRADANAEAARLNAAEAQNVALIAGSQAAFANNDTDTALALAMQAVQMNSDSAFAQAQLSEVAYSPGTVRRYVGHTGGVDVVAISPDNETMLSASWDGTLILWEIATGEILRTYEGHTDMVWAVDMSPDGKLAVSGSADTTAILWDMETGDIIHRLDDFELELAWVEFHPDGRSIIGSGKGTAPPLILWDVQTGEVIRRFEGHTTGVETVRFSPDGNRMVSGSEDGTLILWDVKTGDIIYEINPNLEDSAGSFRIATISPDGRTALVGYSNSDMFLLDLDTGEILQRYSLDIGGVWSVAFHPDGNTALAGGFTGILKLVDLQSGEILHTFSGHFAGIFDIKFMANGRFAMTASIDKTLRMWDLNRGQVIRRFTEPAAQLFEVDLSPDGRTALSGSTDGTFILWDVATGEAIYQEVFEQSVMAVKYSPDGKTAIIGTGYRLAEKIESGHIILWDVEKMQEILRFEGQPYAVFDAEFSPDGTKIVTSGAGAVVILWDVRSGQEIWRFEDYWINRPDNTSFLDVVFSPDGSTILAAYNEGTIVIIDTASGTAVGELVGHENTVIGVAISQDGQRAISGGNNNQAILWDIQTRSIIRRFTNHAGAIGQVRFSPDERFILGGSADGTNSLWNSETGEVIRRYGDGHVQLPDFSEDGHHVLAGFRNGIVELWRIDSTLDELLEWTRTNRYIPELTCEQRELYRVEPFCGDESLG